MVKLRNRLYRKKAYWNFKEILSKKVELPFYRRLNNYEENMDGIAYHVKYSGRLLKPYLTGLLCSIIYIVFFQWISSFSIFDGFNFDAGFSSNVSTILSVIVTVIGVLLGLFFATMNAVAGNQFVKAPKGLQKEFLNDRNRNAYVKILTFTTSTGLVYLLLSMVDIKCGVIGVSLLTLISVYAIVKFLSVGPMIFYFVHPVYTSSNIASELIRNIDCACAGRPGYDKKDMQAHYSLQAYQKITTYEELVEYMGGIDVSNEHYSWAASNLANVLIHYIKNKKYIPTESQWFQKRVEYKSWLLTNNAEVITALKTGTFPLPKKVADNLWFENYILEVYFNILNKLVEKEDYIETKRSLGYLNVVINENNFELYIDVMDMICSKVRLWSEELLTEKSTALMAESIADNLGLMYVSTIANFIEKSGASNVENIIKRISNLNIASLRSIRHNNFLGSMTHTLEDLNVRILNEIRVEKRQITEDWYIEMLLLKNYNNSIIMYYNKIKNYSESLIDLIKQTVGCESYEVSALLIGQWMQMRAKIIIQLDSIQKITNLSIKYNEKNSVWKSIDVDKERRDIEHYTNRVICELSDLIIPLGKINVLKERPDYFGQAYLYSLERLYVLISSNDTDCVKRIFPNVLHGSILMNEHLESETNEWNQESALLAMAEPVIDIVTISGYMKIYAEFYDNDDLWNICLNAWEDYLNKFGSRDPLKAVVYYSGMDFGAAQLVSGRWEQRRGWERDFENIAYEGSRRLDYPFYQNRKMYKNSLIDHLSTSRATGKEVFFATYLWGSIESNRHLLTCKKLDEVKRIRKVLNHNQEENLYG